MKLAETNNFEFQVGMYMPVLNIFLVFFAFMKLMFYLRVFESFGTLVTLTGKCIYDILSFLQFLLIFLGFQAILFNVIGSQFVLGTENGDDPLKNNLYESLTRGITNWICVFRSSIGDIRHPESYQSPTIG